MSGAESEATSVEPSTTTTARPGWACTPDPPQNTKARFPAVFTRSWQRTCLYIILIILTILIFLNIGLTLWIVSALKLTMNRIGPIKIIKDGMELEGHAFINGDLIASSIKSRTAQPITVHSYRNFSIVVSDPDQTEFSRLLIKRNALQFSGHSVVITDSKGNIVFKASAEEVLMAADLLTVQGPGGISVKNSVQTSAVRAPPGFDLELESQTRRLDLKAPQLIQLESRAGGIDITSHDNIKMDSVVGAVKIDAQNIYIHKLREAMPHFDANKTRTKMEKSMKFYQLCACASGKLFLAPSEGLCVAHQDDHELCRL